jgi:hypothetical protein
MYCLCTRCINVNSVQVHSEFGKLGVPNVCLSKHRCQKRSDWMLRINHAIAVSITNKCGLVKNSQKCIVYVHDVLMSTAYKYTPNLESLLTQQYVCVNVHSDLIIHAFCQILCLYHYPFRSYQH